jgi:hypothetical protein
MTSNETAILACAGMMVVSTSLVFARSEIEVRCYLTLVVQ